MGSRGPQPTPTAILKLSGSWRATARERAGEPKAIEGKPRCPRTLKGVAKQKWHEVIGYLDRMGILSRSDRPTLERYCIMYAQWLACIEFLDARGTTVYNAVGPQSKRVNLRPYPQVKEAASLAEALLKIEREFGLTPASRTRITVGGASDGNAEGDPVGTYVA